MIVSFACQTLFIWKITVTAKFDSIFDNPRTTIRSGFWYICIVVSVSSVSTRRYVRYNALILEQKPYKIIRHLVAPCSSGSDWGSESDSIHVPCGNVTPHYPPPSLRHNCDTFINFFRIFLCCVRGKQSCLCRSCRRRHTFGFRLIIGEGMHQ